MVLSMDLRVEWVIAGVLVWLAPVSVQGQVAGSDLRLAEAARAGDAAEIASLLDSGVDVNAPGPQGTTALHWSVYRDDLETAKRLIEAGADVTTENRYGLTALYLAAANGSAEAIRLLLDEGADPDWIDPAGESLLMAVARAGSPRGAEALIAAGATVDWVQEELGQTALMVAVRERQPDVVAVLLASGADPNVRTRVGSTPRWVLPNSQPGFSFGIGIVRGGSPPRGRRAPIPGGLTPLHYAVREGDLASVRFLLEAGARIDERDANDITPLLMAIMNGHAATALELIARGADIDASDWYGRTPLWSAVEARNQDIHNGTLEHMVDREPLVEVIRTLLERGADPNPRTTETFPVRNHILSITASLSWVDFIGQTPFITAALSGDITVMRLLLEHGADPFITTLEGTSALMAAAGVNWVVAQTFDEGPEALLDAVRLSEELGLDVNAANSMGITAVMGAANRGANDVIRFLVGKGARLDVRDNEGRTPLDWAEGVFLATHAAVPKPESVDLITELMREAGIEIAGTEATR
jgi:ankyrin repeat protein